MVDVAELSWTVTGEASGERTAVVLNQMTQAAAGAEAGLDRVGATSKRTATDLAGITSSATSAGGAARQTATEMAGLSGASTNATSSLRDMAQAVMAVDAAESAAAQGARELTSATAGVSPAMDRSAASARNAAVSYGDFYDAAQRDFSTQWAQAGNRVIGTNTKLATSNKHLQQATINMTRQFADVAVTIGTMNPLMVLLQQGPQIADGFQQASHAGLGFKAVLRGVWLELSPILIILAPIIAAVGALTAAFAIGTREINQNMGKVTDGLGLTEAQLERVKHKSVTMGDTMKAVFQVTGRYIKEAFSEEIGAVQGALSLVYNTLITNTVNTVKIILGAFVGAYEAIRAVWGLLPGALGDLAVQAANAVIAATEGMINKAIAGINALRPALNMAAKMMGQAFQIPELDDVAFERVANKNAGAAAKAGSAAMDAFGAGMKSAWAGVDKFLADVQKQAFANARAAALKEAGKAAKGAKDASDKLAESLARELEAMARTTGANYALAEAYGVSDEAALRAMAAVDATGKAIKRQGDVALFVEAQLRLNASKEAVRNAERLSALEFESRVMGELDAKVRDGTMSREEANAQLAIEKDLRWTIAAATAAQGEELDALNKRMAKYRADAAAEAKARKGASDEDKLRDMIRDQQRAAELIGKTAVEQAKLNAEWAIEDMRLDALNPRLQQMAEFFVLLAENAAKDPLGDMIRELEEVADLVGQAASGMEAAFGRVGGAIGGVASILADYGAEVKRVDKLVKDGQLDAAQGERRKAMTTVQAYGDMLGAAKDFFNEGSTGYKVLAAAEKAMRVQQFFMSLQAMAQSAAETFALLAQNTAKVVSFKTVEVAAQSAWAAILGPIGWAATALSFVFSLFGGGGSSKKKQKAEEEAKKAEEIAKQRAELEIALMKAQGDAAGALAAERKKELAEMDASLRALQEQVWAAEDLAAAQERAREIAREREDIEVEIMRLLGDEAGALVIERQRELAELDESNRALKERVYALQDEAAAMERLAEARDFAADIAQDLLTRIDPFQGALAGLARSQAARQAEVDALRNVLPVDEFATLTDQVARLNALELDEIMAKFTVDLIAGSKALQEGLGAFLPGGGITTADEIAADRQRRLDAERAAAADSATAAEEAAAAWAETVKAVEDGRRGLILAGNVAGALAAEWSITKLDPGTFTRRDGSINIGALNFEVAKAQADNAKRLANLASANALQVQDVGRVLTQLRAYVGDNLDNPLGGGVNQGMLSRIAGIVGAGYSEAIRDAVQGLTGVLANEQVRQRYQAGGPGLAGVRFAQESLAFAREARDVVAYRDAIGQLQGQLREGVITFGDYTRAVEAVDQLMGSAIAYLDPVMAAIREAGAIAGYQQAGLDSIAYYFGEIASATAALNAAAAEAEEPISLVAAAVGRLTSIAQVFNESVAAATYMGANADNADVATAQLIAEAAAVAARVITTADAARIAAEIANDPAFAGMSPTALRDTSLLLDGLQAFDPVAFENTFLRLNNALVTEAITREQYAVLFNRSLDIFSGMDEAAKAIDDMRRAAGSFADAFLLSSGTTLMGRAQFAEAYRQYQGLLARVRGGDVGAFGDLTDAATTLRDRGNSTFSTFLEAQNLQDQIVDAFRDIEANGIATSHEERLELGVNRMADTAERMEDLLERGNALLASIDGNQAEQRKTVERSLAQT